MKLIVIITLIACHQRNISSYEFIFKVVKEGNYGLGTSKGHHFRLFVFHTMPEVTTFWGGCAIRFAPCR